MKLTKVFWWIGIVVMFASACFDGPFSWLLFTFGFVLALTLAGNED